VRRLSKRGRGGEIEEGMDSFREILK